MKKKSRVVNILLLVIMVGIATCSAVDNKKARQVDGQVW